MEERGIASCMRSTDFQEWALTDVHKTGSTNNAAETQIDSKPASGELTVWAMGNEGDLLSDFVKGFEKDNPDAKVKVTAIPWASAHDKIQTAIAAGTVPDVIQMGTTWMADFSAAFDAVPRKLRFIRFY